MKIILELNLSEDSLEFLEPVAKEMNMTVTQVAKKFSKDPLFLELLGEWFCPLVTQVYKKEKSKKKG